MTTEGYPPVERDELASAQQQSGYGAWVTLVIPPVIWLVQMQLNYWFVRGACAHGSNTPLYVASIVSVVCVCVEGFVCWLAWQRVKRAWPAAYRDEDSRDRFLAMVGLLTAGMFLLVIIAQGIAGIFLDPCQL